MPRGLRRGVPDGSRRGPRRGAPGAPRPGARPGRARGPGPPAPGPGGPGPPIWGVPPETEKSAILAISSILLVTQNWVFWGVSYRGVKSAYMGGPPQDPVPGGGEFLSRLGELLNTLQNVHPRPRPGPRPGGAPGGSPSPAWEGSPETLPGYPRRNPHTPHHVSRPGIALRVPSDGVLLHAASSAWEARCSPHCEVGCGYGSPQTPHTP